MAAALLAQAGFTASEVALEGFDGWAQAMSTRHDWNEVTEGLGRRYEIALNTYKPFACGIVAHPAIDAAIQLRNENSLKPETIKAINLKVHPLVLNLMGKTEPVGPQILPHILDRVQLRGARGQEDQRQVLRHDQMARGVPSGAVEQQDRMGPSGHSAGDLVEVKLHGFGVGVRQREGGTCAARWADRAKQIGALVALVGRLAGA